VRICGECTACCKSVALPEFNKATNEPCEHLREGCGIHETRPESCRAFQCAWLSKMTGFKDESMRPDRCGVVAAVGPTEHGRGVYFYSVWKGATDEDRIQSIMRIYNLRFPILLVSHTGNRGGLLKAGEA